MYRRISFTPKTWFCVIAVCLVASGVFLSKEAVAHQLTAWQLLPKPESFTQLYFPPTDQLPAALYSNTPQPLRATVRNNEHQTTDYTYTLLVSNATKKQIVKTGHFTIEANHQKTISTTFSIPPNIFEGRTMVQLLIEYRNASGASESQSIHYWATIGKQGGA